MSLSINAFDVGGQYFSYFGVKPKFDGWLSLLYHRTVLDMFAFDDFLHSKYGDYEAEGKSMHDVVLEHYGEKAASFCSVVFGIGEKERNDSERVCAKVQR